MLSDITCFFRGPEDRVIMKSQCSSSTSFQSLGQVVVLHEQAAIQRGLGYDKTF